MVWACGTHGRLPSCKTSLSWPTENWGAPRHKPKKRFRDYVKANLKLLEIDVDSWEVLAGNQNEWGRSAKGVTRSK